ncbi:MULTISPECIES: plasmid partition protein ParG [Corynebacterium]|uniref:plasmid partition protein ParG n=1 Tax=Corynebacterium TaxID=1716 RepID=UPI003FCF3217
MATKKNSLADTMRPSMNAAKKKVAVEDTLRPEPSGLSRRTTVYFSEETAKELKIAAIEDGTNMSQIVEDLVADWLVNRSREQRR